MKNNKEKAAKYIWEKYLKENVPPEGIPRDPEKEYGDKFKGWVHFLLSIQHHFTEKNKK